MLKYATTYATKLKGYKVHSINLHGWNQNIGWSGLDIDRLIVSSCLN